MRGTLYLTLLTAAGIVNTDVDLNGLKSVMVVGEIVGSASTSNPKLF